MFGLPIFQFSTKVFLLWESASSATRKELDRKHSTIELQLRVKIFFLAFNIGTPSIDTAGGVKKQRKIYFLE